MKLRRRAFAPALLVAAALAGVAAANGGCSRGAPGHAVDERLLLAIEEARALQHRADLHLEGGDVAAAIADVEAVLKVAFPPGAPEGEEARLDGRARLARLHLGAGDEASALAELAAGEREATRDSFYRAHLETTRGEVLEARGKRLDSSDPAGAKQARKDALDAYARSIEINRRVQAALLRGAP